MQVTRSKQLLLQLSAVFMGGTLLATVMITRSQLLVLPTNGFTAVDLMRFAGGMLLLTLASALLLGGMLWGHGQAKEEGATHSLLEALPPLVGSTLAMAILLAYDGSLNRMLWVGSWVLALCVAFVMPLLIFGKRKR